MALLPLHVNIAFESALGKVPLAISIFSVNPVNVKFSVDIEIVSIGIIADDIMLNMIISPSEAQSTIIWMSLVISLLM